MDSTSYNMAWLQKYSSNTWAIYWFIYLFIHIFMYLFMSSFIYLWGGLGCSSLPGVLLGCIYVSLGCAGLIHIRLVIYLFFYHI